MTTTERIFVVWGIISERIAETQNNHPIVGIGCCARAASGHAMAEAVTASMKSRRRRPKAQDYATMQLQQVLRPSEWGSATIVRGANPKGGLPVWVDTVEKRFSALG